MTTRIFNLIILDESGSMYSIRKKQLMVLMRQCRPTVLLKKWMKSRNILYFL